jgi:acetyl esterase/lipase
VSLLGTSSSGSGGRGGGHRSVVGCGATSGELAKQGWQALCCGIKIVLPALFLGWLLLGLGAFVRYQLDPPGDVATAAAAAAAAAGCTSCFCDERFPVATHNISVARDIQYAAAYSRAQNGEQPLLLDVYSLAAAGGGSEPRPTVVFVHGGGFVGGTKKSRLVVGEAERLVRRGFIAVSIEYRLAASSFLPELAAVRDAVQDAKAAVRWLVTNAEEYRIDPHRIAVWGGALALGLQPARRPPPARGLSACASAISSIFCG